MSTSTTQSRLLQLSNTPVSEEVEVGSHLELDKVNPKLKQFYKNRMRIEPFFTGGKIVILSDIKILCQCFPVVKLISISNVIKTEDDTTSSTPDVGDKSSKSSFEVCHTYECDLDDILSFDACAVTQYLITGHQSKLLRIWNLETHEIVRTIKSFHNLPINTIEIHKFDRINLQSTNDNDQESAQNDLSWVSVSGNNLKFWNVGGNQVSKVVNIGQASNLTFVKWDKSEKLNRVFLADRNIFVVDDYDGSAGEYTVSHVLEGHYSQVTGIEFFKGETMISGGRDKVIILWDMINSFSKLKTISFPNSIEAMIRVSKTSLYVAANPSDIYHFDLKTHKLSPKEFSLGGDETIVAFHPCRSSTSSVKEELNGFFISTHTCALYNVVCDLKSKKVNVGNQFVGNLDEILAVSIWTSNNVVIANNTSVIKVYNLMNGSCEFLRGHKDIVVSLSTKKTWLVSGSKDNCVILWSSESTSPHATFSGHIASITAVCFHPIKDKFYSAAEDNFLKCWDFNDCIGSVNAHPKEINSIDCSPNGALIASASRDKTAKLWDADLNCLTTLKGHKKGVWDVKFSLWDQLLVTSSADSTIKIWNLASYDCIKTLQGHLSSVLQAQFVNQGLQIISTSSDGTLKSWDLRNSTCLSTWECGNDKVWALDSQPDGSIILTGTADSIVTVWEDITEEKVEESREKRKQLLEHEQMLANVIRESKWEEAVFLAINLDRPLTLLKVIREIPSMEQLSNIVASLDSEQIQTLTKYVRRWNSNTKTSTEAQVMLNILMRVKQPSELQFLDTSSLLPYSQKHYKRLEKLGQTIALMKFISSDFSNVL